MTTDRPLILGYIRVSTDHQDLSLDAQQATVQRAANYKFGEGSDVELFCEPDTSGSIPFAEREQGQSLLLRVRTAAALGQPVTILVPKLDRFGRDTVDVSSTVKALEQMGASLHFLDLNVDTRTATGKFFMHICAAFAEMELSRIRERIQTALDHKRSQGLLTGTVPYGWDALATGDTNAQGKPIRKLAPNAAEQKTLLLMATLKASGWSYNQIACELNRRKIPTKNAGQLVPLKGGTLVPSKGLWQFGHIARILNSKTVRLWLEQEHQLKLAA